MSGHDTRMSAHDTRRPPPSWVRPPRREEREPPIRAPLQVKHAISREPFQREPRIPSPSPVVRVESDEPRRVRIAPAGPPVKGWGWGFADRREP